VAHWPSSAGACAPVCACCPVCHAVGRPLNSNVRQHTQALRTASISIQMQLLAAVASIQIAVPSFFVAVAKVVAKPTTRAVTNAALTSFGVREPRSRSARSQNTTNSCRWLSRLTKLKPELPGCVVASQVIAAQGSQSRSMFWPFQVVGLVQQGQGGCRGASGQILVAVGCVSRTVGQCKQEAQRCLTHRSSGAPTSRRAGHQAQGLRPILRLLSSAPRCWLPLTSNVRPHRTCVHLRFEQVLGVWQEVLLPFVGQCASRKGRVSKPWLCQASVPVSPRFGCCGWRLKA
jgi:hypothetical protein